MRRPGPRPIQVTFPCHACGDLITMTRRTKRRFCDSCLKHREERQDLIVAEINARRLARGIKPLEVERLGPNRTLRRVLRAR